MRSSEYQLTRPVQQTETLKNLFVLYFSILKSPMRSPLLAAALEGISRFAHLVNIDFFRDLLAVLRKVIADQFQDEDDAGGDPVGAGQRIRIRLLGIVTAFDLLSGQGASSFLIEGTNMVHRSLTISKKVKH